MKNSKKIPHYFMKQRLKKESVKRKERRHAKAESVELMVLNMQFPSFVHSINEAKRNLPRDTVQKKAVVKSKLCLRNQSKCKCSKWTVVLTHLF